MADVELLPEGAPVRVEWVLELADEYDTKGQHERAHYLRTLAAQQPAGVGGTATNSAVAAIQFALKDPEGMTFLRLWNEGEFDTLRREWPDAPIEVYIGADPLAAHQQGGA